MSESKDRQTSAGEHADGFDRPEAVHATTVVALIASAAVVLYLLRHVLLPFVLAGIVAYIFTPLVTRLAELMRLPRWLMALAFLFLLTGMGAVVGVFFLPSLFEQIAAVGRDLRATIEGLTKKLAGEGSLKLLGETIDASRIASYAESGLRDWFGASGRVFEIFTISFASFFGVILTWVLLAFLLIDGPRLGGDMMRLLPPRRRPAAARIWGRLDLILRRYFVGLLLVVIYAWAAAYIGLGVFLGLRHATVLALITGLLEVIPMAGPAASAVIAGLAAVEEAKSAGDIAVYIVYATALRVSIDQFVGPIVLGHAAYLRPVVVIFCFLAGAALFGVIGMVLAVPVALATKVVLSAAYNEDACSNGPAVRE